MPNWTKEQSEAINSDGSNIIVSAGAGSGKTAVLTRRVIRKLESGVNINELLVLTFTKAAAKEMKERIRKAIKEQDSLVEQLDYIDSSYITTFDSYALSIVKKYHYLLNVSKNVSIVDSTIIEAKKSLIIDKIFDELYTVENSSFLKLIGDLCIKDDKQIKKLILNISSKLDLKYNKLEYLDNYINHYYSEDKINSIIRLYEEVILDKITAINDNLIEIEPYLEVDYYKKLEDSLRALLFSSSYEEVRDCLEFKMPNYKKTGDEATDAMVDKYKSNIANIKKELKNNLCIYTIKEIKENILKTKEYIEAIILIIRKLDEIINLYKEETLMYEFIDINKLAIKIVKEYKEVRDELKYYYNEILIDEYQDTNDLQEEFVSAIENNNVYMVGDIKQSIYRFRNANPNLFKSKYIEYSKNNNGIKIDLNKNFRSRKEVLADINLIFDDIMSIDCGGADYRNSHRMVFGNNDYEEIGNAKQNQNLEMYTYVYDKSLGYDKAEIEVFIIAKDIKEKIDSKYQVFDKDKGMLCDVTYKDFVILIDRAKEFERYKKIFEYLNMPITKYNSTNITEASDTLIVKNIIGLILKIKKSEFDRDFKHFFMSIGRSYLFGYSDEELFNYITNNTYKESSLWNVASNIAVYIDSLTNNEVMDMVVEDFSIYNSLIKVGDIENAINRIDYLLDISSSISSLGNTIEDFYNYLDTAIKDEYRLEVDSVDLNEDSVKLMKVHASKGLEFHVTYFPGLTSEFNMREINSSMLYDENLGIITPYFDNGIGETICKYLAKDNYKKEEISEKIRLFYVALTRSREKIILIYPLEEKKMAKEKTLIESKSFGDFIKYVYSSINKVSKDTDSLGLTRDYNIIKKSNYKDSIKRTDKKIVKREIDINYSLINTKKFSKENIILIDSGVKANMEFGSYMHYLLEMIDFKNPDLDILELDDDIIDKIKRFLSLDLDFKNAIIYKEFEFVYEDINDDNHHGIIDLMLEYDDCIKIIDYKLKNIADEAYVGQLNGYREYIKLISNKEVSIYLYSFSDCVLKEIDSLVVV